MSEHQTQQVRIIRPDSRVNDGALAALSHLLGEIWHFRSHIRIVFKEQFRAAYSGTGLGLFWNYALPLVPLTVYWFLSKLRVFPDFDGVDSAVYLTFGVTIWFLLAGCVQTPIQVVQSRNKEAMKTTFPLSASIVSGFARLLFDTLVRLVLVIVVVAVTQSWPTWLGLLLPFVLLPGLLLFMGAGLLLGILNVIYNDVSRVVNIALQYGIFVSGVIFPLPAIGLLKEISLYNPFFVFIESSRSIVFLGGVEHVNAYIAMSVAALAVFISAARLFYIMEYRVRGIS
jgi:ABC-type polysaccharide/polyol phosphate export permease